MRICLFCLLGTVSAVAQDPVKPVFEAQTIDAKIQIGYGLAIGDVDGDGKPDVILADKSDVVWYANPSWEKHVLAARLTAMDNVCVAARDIDGDGKVEIAVGAQWNPGETTDEAQSGAVFFLDRPENPKAAWTPVKLAHEPTVHRMKWVKVGESDFRLIVVPLHGRGNNAQTGEGEPPKILAYEPPADRAKAEDWKTSTVDTTLHKTHNFDVRKARAGSESVWVGGLEGARELSFEKGEWSGRTIPQEGLDRGIGEIRGAGSQILAVIQPMHGNEVAVYHDDFGRTTLDDTLNQGHALLCQPLLGGGFPEIVAGWREKNPEGKVGLKMFVRDDSTGKEKWITHVIDDSTMACEDLMAADLNGDEKLDLIASGRATKNVIIYWNKTTFAVKPQTDRPELPPLSEAEKAAVEQRKEKK